MNYTLLSKICAISSIFFGITVLMNKIMIRRFIKNNLQKTIDEVQPQLIRFSIFMVIASVLSGIFGIIAVILR